MRSNGKRTKAPEAGGVHTDPQQIFDLAGTGTLRISVAPEFKEPAKPPGRLNAFAGSAFGWARS